MRTLTLSLQRGFITGLTRWRWQTTIILLQFAFAFQSIGQSSFTWYFGNLGGITFNTSGTTAPAPGSGMNAGEGCTVVSDTAGIVIFYSDGVSVWNNISPTPVFTGLPGSNSSTQAALALAVPGTNCERFLIFTTKGVEQTGAHDLGIALVTITGTSPNYMVSVSSPALSVIQPSGSVFFGEKLAATSDTAGGYWVMAHDYISGSGTANTFYKYHITSANFSSVTTTAQAQAVLSSIQQTQSVGSNHRDASPPTYNAQGQMKFSKTGQKLALVLAGSKTIDLFDFDLTTGLLTQLATTNISGSNGNLYGCELSPLGNMLYTSEGFASSGSTIRKLYQWDIGAGTLSNPYIVASGPNVYNNRYKYNALQLGPNDKIYCSEESSISSLSVIQYPNLPGSACGWSSMTETIAGSNTLGLTTVIPNFGCACLPSPGAIAGPASVCRGATGKIYTVTAIPGATGYTWTLPAGAVITSGNNTNSVTVTFTVSSVSGNFSVFAYNPSCVGMNSPSFPVIVHPVPSVELGPDIFVCQGQTATFNAGTCSGCTYRWDNLTTGQLNIGNGSTYTTGTAGAYTVSVTSPAGCIGKDTIQLFVQALAPVTVGITASANPVCSGTLVTYSANGQPAGNPSGHIWRINGSVVPGVTGSVWSYSPADGDCIQCTYSSNAICTTGNPASSNMICMTVNQTLPVFVSVLASDNPVCSGEQVNYMAIPVNPGSSPLYQWYVNSTPVGSNSTILTWIPQPGDCITCILNSNDGCATGNPASSNPICMTVNPVLSVNISVAASDTTICHGTNVTYQAFPVNGGNSPEYQWQVNNVGVSYATGAVFNFIPVDGDQISCTVFSSEACPDSNQVTSSPIIMTVLPLLPVGISISASENPYCAGDQVIFTAIGVNGGTDPEFQWYNNGIAAGADLPSFVTTPSGGDLISCVYHSSEVCASGNPATSNIITMTETARLSAGVSVIPSANPVCHGNQVTFIATPVNGGITPSYQWEINGMVVDSGLSAAFTFQPAGGDIITCTMTSDLNCLVSNPVNSSPVVMNENPKPVVTLTACNDTITSTDAVPFRLRGGQPAGGIYTGTGVNQATGEFSPSLAGAGRHIIKYRFPNIYNCSDSAIKSIRVLPSSSFTCGDNLTDMRDHKSYATVLIGNQCWMKENLKYGSIIPYTESQTDNCTAERYTRISATNISTSFYQWNELMNYDSTAGSQGLCPPGWHIPASAEWELMLNLLEGPGMAGSWLKDNDITGSFTSLQYGLLYQNHTWSYFAGFYAGAMYWTSTAIDSHHAVARGINEYNKSVSRYHALTSSAFNVRCLKD